MYSVVLAAMLTAGPAVLPGFGHGCHPCCGGHCGWSSGCGNWSSDCGNWSSGYCGYCCGCGWSSGCGNWSSGVVTVAPTYADPALVEPAQESEEERVRVIVVPSYAAPTGPAPPTPSFSPLTPGVFDQPSAVPLTTPQIPSLPPLAPGTLDQPSAPPSAIPLTTPQLPALPQPQPQPPQTAASFHAIVVVKAPLDAAVLANGQLIEHAKTEQRFITPNLKPGKTYFYEFRAEAVRDGKTVTLSQKVTVKAGLELCADFSELSRRYAPAVVAIKAPADARLTVDGVEGPMTSRTFNTPTLESGRAYFYTVKAEMVRDGRAVRDSKHVMLEAGKEVKVEFKEPSVATAER